MREFTVIRSRRRTMALQVTREGQVVVRAPIYAARGDIHRFVTAHIRHKNHGPDFYALVRRTLPDYDSRIKILK